MQEAPIGQLIIKSGSQFDCGQDETAEEVGSQQLQETACQQVQQAQSVASSLHG